MIFNQHVVHIKSPLQIQPQLPVHFDTIQIRCERNPDNDTIYPTTPLTALIIVQNTT